MVMLLDVMHNMLTKTHVTSCSHENYLAKYLAQYHIPSPLAPTWRFVYIYIDLNEVINHDMCILIYVDLLHLTKHVFLNSTVIEYLDWHGEVNNIYLYPVSSLSFSLSLSWLMCWQDMLSLFGSDWYTHIQIIAAFYF